MASNPFDYAERFNPNRRSIASVQPKDDPTDPVGAEIDRMREESIRDTFAILPQPNHAARVTRLAREADVNPVYVEDDPDTVDAALRTRKFNEIAKRYPAIGRFAVRNPRGAAAAQDDHKSLGLLGEAWDGLKTIGQRLGVTGSYVAGGMLNDLYGLGEQAQDVIGAPVRSVLDALGVDVNRAMKRREADRAGRRAYFDQAAEASREGYRGRNAIAEGLLQGTEQAIPSIGAALTGGATSAASVFALTVGAGSFETARSQGLDVPTSIRYGVTQGAVEGLTEKIPAGTLVDLIARKTPWAKAFVRELGQEMTGEQVATFLQDFSDFATLPENRNKTLADFARERPQAALQTGLAVAGGTSATVGAIGAAQRATDATRAVAGKVSDARQARSEARFLDQAAKGVELSNLKPRDAEAFRSLMREHAEEAGARNIYVPAEAVREFFQSDRFDPDANPFDPIAWQEADASGGDMVIPIEDALTDLVGTPAWEAVKDHVRLTPGGMSKAEADAFESGLDKTVSDIADRMAETSKSDAERQTVRDKLVDEVASQFGASYTAPAARQIAEIAVQRAEARAARMGVDLTGEEFKGFDVKQVMPEGVAQAVKADELDLVINAMRGRGDVEVGKGQTLLEWIKARGGLNDTGGDLASMGLPKGMIRSFNPDQGALSGLTGEGVYGLDTTFTDAREAGYFPQFDGRSEDTYADALDGSALLLDAITAELGGSPVYSETKRDWHREAGDDLRGMLEQAGLDPDTMSDAEVRAAVDRMGKESEGGRAFTQSDMSDGVHGRVRFFDQNKRTIELFQSRNLSTALHELSHMWLEELRFDAEQPDAPQQLKDDWAKVQSWFAANGHPIGEDGQIPTEAHELWARSGERYFMEGKAPTTALTRLFETFRSWLVNIYRTVDRLRAPITPEIREVFDRLLATDEEIAQVAEAQNIAALFKDAAEIGMSGPEFTAYQAQVEDAKAGAHAKLLDKTMATIRRREQERYRDARKRIKAEETERIDASPVFKALSLMKAERLSRDWLADRFGEDVFDLLPVRVPPIYSDTGIDPEVVSERAGYPSAKDMIEALIGAERAHRQAKEGGDQRSMRARTIDNATDEEFARRYGDPLNDGSIEREALAAVHSEMQGEVIATEIRVLARKSGQRPTPYRIARNWARGKIRSGLVVEEASASAIQRYARNAAKAGRAAEEAMLKQDVEEAFRQKQFQMLNNALLAEAKEAGDEVQAAVKRMDKIARARTRKSVDQDYLEQAQALLEAVDLRQRSQVSLDKAGKWEAWAAEREAEGFDLIVPPSFEAMLGKTNWTRLSVENLLALDEAVKQVMHLGRLKQTLLDNAEQREWDEIVGEVEAQADDIGRKPPSGSFTEPSWWDSVKAKAATVDAALLKMEQVFDWLDNGNSNGVFNRIVFRPMAEAQAREQDMLRDYYGRLNELMQNVPAGTLKTWGDKLTLDLIDRETGLPAEMTRQKLIAMALNWGNAGNRQRLTDGYGWNEQGVERALMENLTAEEWQFVQDVWDLIDGLWPDIEKMERAINGVAPDKVEATEVVTPFGTMRGGYYPAIYDATLDYTAEERAGRKADLFEATYVRATTRASATKDRAEKVSRPILLDIGVINRHLGEVIHDVTHREPVMRAHRFLTNRRVMRAVDETLGPEVRKQFRPWLQHIANSWASERAGNEGLGKFLTKARANVTVVGMGWRFTTMLTQIAGYSNSTEMVGAKGMVAAIAQTAANPIETFDFVMERSDEMRGRMDTLDRDIRLAIRQQTSALGGAADKLSAVRRFAYHGIGYMDRMVTIPTWIGAYNKALSEGMNERDAAYAGDKAVRLSQGAGGTKDLAAVANGQGKYGEVFKIMTMFYSYLSTVYSRQRNLGRDTARANAADIPALMARAWWLIVVPPLLAEILSGRGPDDDEDWAWWAFSKMLSQSLGAIPGVRDVVEPTYAAITGKFSFGYRLSPLQAAGESVVKVGKDIGKAWKGKDTTRATRDVLEATGYFTGLVPGQIAAATQFLVDVGSGDADPETIGDWYTGLTKGRMPAE